MKKYKTYEELKEELGDKFEEYMYKANIELLTKIEKLRMHIMCIKEAIEVWDLDYKDGYVDFEIPKKIKDVVFRSEIDE